MKAVTHDGSFHADDVFAYAVLRAAVPGIALERTRDADAVERADLVFDVGGLFDPQTRRFDHHMRDRPLRDDGTPYSSLGLLWREYGRTAVAAFLGGAEPDVVEAVWRELDGSLVVEIDRTDNGIGLAGAG
ncbi:MAG TPA: MYG1 family protein, partial [Beijerinckiaceae bacterium]|nr:MYG1 family protein [Beijerinckiaceae bacterium]